MPQVKIFMEKNNKQEETMCVKTALIVRIHTLTQETNNLKGMFHTLFKEDKRFERYDK